MKLSSSALPSASSPVIRMTYLWFFSDFIAVPVDERLPHPLGVVDVLAEDDGLGEAVGGLEKFGDLPGDELGALLEDERAVQVELVVDAVLDELAVFVELARVGPPAVESLSRSMRMTL